MTDDKDDLIRQLTIRLRETVDENDKLRALVANLTEGANAHQTLQSLYRNVDLPESLRAKAATAALPHEVPRLAPVEAPLDLVAEEIEPLAVVVERQRARMNRLLDLTSIDVVPIADGRRGNGSND